MSIANISTGACILLAAGGYTDKGALGVNRVYRLPGSVNGKYSEPWECQVRVCGSLTGCGRWIP